jgi:hypothetical protein
VAKIDLDFEYHPEAIHEAWESYHWYEEGSEAVADDFWNQLRHARQWPAFRPPRNLI